MCWVLMTPFEIIDDWIVAVVDCYWAPLTQHRVPDPHRIAPTKETIRRTDDPRLRLLTVKGPIQQLRSMQLSSLDAAKGLGFLRIVVSLLSSFLLVESSFSFEFPRQRLASIALP